MSSVYNDGSAAASTGAAQLPTLLDGYATRPPWEVAGVDYAVGVPAGTAMKDPATLAMAGVSVNAGQHVVYVTGDNVTLSGYDFGLSGGYSVVIGSGVANTLIENSSFAVGSNQQVPIQAGGGVGNLTVSHCSLDGGGSTSDAAYALISYNGNGTLTAQYNSFTNAPSDGIDFSSGNLSYDVKYNVFENLGASPGSHPDSIQEYGGNSTNSVFDFNTVYQPNSSGMQGIQLEAQGGSTIANTQIENNVVVAKGPGIKMSYSIAVIELPGSPIVGATVSNNYIDSSGAYGPFYPPSGSGLTFSGNVDLSTGATLAAPPGTSPGAPSGPPSLNWSTSSVIGTEGSSIALGALSETLNGETGKSLVVSGIPAGAKLTDGTNAFTASATATAVSVAGWNLGALTITPAADGGFTLTATATTTSPTGGTGGSATTAKAVTVAPLAPSVAWAATGPGVAGEHLTLGSLTDAVHGLPGDRNTLQSLVVSGAPTGAVLSDGAHSFTATAAAGAVDVAGWNLAGLQIVSSSPAAFTLTATAIAQDVAGATSQASASEPVALAAPPGPPPGPVPGPADQYADGASGASAGAPQMPSLFSSDATRPAWKVAGVNYAVGVPAGSALRDPTAAANLPAGASIDAANRLIHVSGNNVTLTGFDFGLHGGWGVEIDAGTTGTTVISNSNFSMGSGQPIAINATSTNVGNLTVLGDTFNGNRQNIPSTQPPPAGSGLGAAINYNGSGAFTAEYNYMYGLPADGIDFSRGTVTPTIKYNLFAGLGYTPGAHPDPVQFYADQVNNATIAFNTIYSPQGSNLSANEGLQIQAQGGSTITNTTIENNTIVATGPRMTQSLNIATWQDPGNTLQGVIVANNYLDPSATYEAFGSGGSTPQGSNLTFVDNVNLLNGAQIGSPSGTRPSDVVGVTASPSNGVQTTGAALLLTLRMDQAATVRGTPTLSLNDGGTASYVSGSGTNALQFSYIVGAGDTPVADLAVTGVTLPSGASVQDAAGSPQNLAGAAASLPGLSIGPTSASNTITLNLSEDAYLGDAQFLVAIDGVQQGGAKTVTALHGAGQSQAFTYAAGPGVHAVDVSFINDAYGGSPSLDRNLYINSIADNGAAVPGSTVTISRDSTVTTEVGTPPPPPPPPANDDTLVLNLSQDAYLGDAKFIAYVDGKALGPAQAVSALHSSGGSEAFTFYGAFGAGPHAVEVDFVNDAYGGSPSLDRNLYVNSIAYDGKLYANDKATMYRTSGYQFTSNIADLTSNTGVPVPLH